MNESRLCDFVEARLAEIEESAPLLGAGKHTGAITQNWVEREIQEKRRTLQFYRDNLALGRDPKRSSAMHSLRMAIYSMADVFYGHPDYDRELWGE